MVEIVSVEEVNFLFTLTQLYSALLQWCRGTESKLKKKVLWYINYIGKERTMVYRLQW